MKMHISARTIHLDLHSHSVTLYLDYLYTSSLDFVAHLLDHMNASQCVSDIISP